MSKLICYLVLTVSVVSSGDSWTKELPIHSAITSRDNVTLEQLLKDGADVEALTPRRDTPFLHLLRQPEPDTPNTSWNRMDAAKLLLEYKANPNVVSMPPFKSPLLLAAEQGDEPMVDLLLKYGADMNLKMVSITGGLGCTALHLMIQNDNKEGAKLLLLKGADVNAKGGCGRPPLFHAIPEHSEMLKILISGGAELNVKNKHGDTPLHYMAKLNSQDTWKKNYRADIIKTLVEGGADLEAKNKSGKTPLFVAAETRYPRETVSVFLKYGANFENSDDLGLQITAFPDSYSDERVRDWFEEHVQNVNQTDKAGNSLLHKAVWGGRVKAANELLTRGANINAGDQRGMTALHIAAFNSQPEMINLLIQHKADVNALNKGGWTPLHYLSKSLTIGQEMTERRIPRESLVLLLSHGARVDIKNQSGQSPLDFQRFWRPRNQNGKNYQSEMLRLLKSFQGNNETAINAAQKKLYHEDVYIRRKAALDLYYLNDYSGVPLMIESIQSSKDALTISVANAVLREITDNDFSNGKSIICFPQKLQKEIVKKWTNWWQENRNSIKTDEIDRKDLLKVLKNDPAYRKQRLARCVEEKDSPERPVFEDTEKSPLKTFEKFIAALRAGDDTKALTFMTMRNAEDYKLIFNSFDDIGRHAFIKGMADAVIVFEWGLENMLGYEMFVEEDDAIRAYPINFVKDGDGGWLIDGF